MKAGQSTEAKNRLVIAKAGEGRMGVITIEFRVSSYSHEDVQESDCSVVVQPCEYTKNHGIVL